MPVSGVLLTCKEEALEKVRESISARPQVEVREGEGSMLVVVTDTETMAQDRELVKWLAKLPGVLTAFVAFSNIEDVAENAAGGMQ
jgi:nitrate reductase NapAB chaperone NapD